jgi:tetratricopeptide (TPR) repeat protein
MAIAYLQAISAAVILSMTGIASAQHGSHGSLPADSAWEVGSDSIQFATTCSASIADDMNRGVAMLHSFWFAEAINTFNRVLRDDPECTIAYWGIALAHWGNPFAGQRNAQQLARGQGTLALANSSAASSAREMAYLSAAAELFADSDPANQYQRTVAYEQAMARLSMDYPEDTEARIFYALAMNQTADPADKSYTQQLRAIDILEPLFESNPNHPGLAHYIIHAYDHPPLASRAMAAAERYAALAPDAPHALHMPSHTFTRVGMWQASVDANLRSAAAARAENDAGSELHALDYQTYAYLQMAEDSAAARVVARTRELIAAVDITAVGATQAGAFAIAAIPARYALERGAWSEAADLEVVHATTPHTQAMTHFARGIGRILNGQPESATDDILMLAELRNAAVRRNDLYWAEQIDIQWQASNAWLNFAAGEHAEAIRRMSDAADTEDLTDKASVTPGPLIPAREMLGMMLLESGQYADALNAFETTLTIEPNRFRTLYGAARAAQLGNHQEKATHYYQQLLRVAGPAAIERPELQHAREYLR